MPALDEALAIDVGGTKVAAGRVSRTGRLLDRTRLDTPLDDPDDIVEAIVAAVELVGRDTNGLPVGVGAAGLVDRNGNVPYAPNLPLRNYPLQQELNARLHCSVVVDNDANAAVWGEYRVGAARDTGSAVMLTVGTGIGGGLVLDDRLARGANGFGGEFGHMIVAEGARLCACGNRGCLEALASGTAIGRTVEEWIADGRVPQSSALADLEEVTGAAVGGAAQAGDATAIAAVAECGRWLGIGLAAIVNSLDPEVVVVGGGAATLDDLLLGPARETFTARVMGHEHRTLPEVVVGELGGDAGLIGAGLLALEAP